MQVNPQEVSAEKATTAATDLRLVSVEQLQKIHRELDACQKVIWLAGCRPRVPNGFDPAYVTGALEQLEVIENLLASAQPDALDDTARLNFMLEKFRQVMVELVPSRSHDHEVYVEEGFMADKKYPAVTNAGDWVDASAVSKEVKRKAIDAAITFQKQGGAA